MTRLSERVFPDGRHYSVDGLPIRDGDHLRIMWPDGTSSVEAVRVTVSFEDYEELWVPVPFRGGTACMEIGVGTLVEVVS